MRVRSLALAAVALCALAVGYGTRSALAADFCVELTRPNSTAEPSDGGMTTPAPEVIPQI